MKRTKIWKISIPFIMFLLASSIIIIPILLDHVYYLMADDYLMNLIAQGEFGNGADSHIIFINIIWGKVLQICYNVFPNINWYICGYVLTVIGVFFTLMFVVWKITGNYFTIAVIGFLEGIAVYHLTFTIIAYLNVGAAVVVAYAVSKQWEILTRTKKVISIIAIVTFWGVGILYRQSVWASALIVLAPLLYKSLKRNKRLGFMLILLFAIETVCASLATKSAYESNKFWSEYTHYNSLRAAVLDNAGVDFSENSEKILKLGMTENDLTCLYKWIFADKEVFSEENLRELSQINKVDVQYNTNIIAVLTQMFQLKYNYWFLACVVLSILLASKRKEKFNCIIFALFTYSMIAALFVRNRPVERVMIPIYLLGIIGLLVESLENAKLEFNRKVLLVVMGSAFISCGMYKIFSNNNQIQKEYMEKNKRYQQVYEYINDSEGLLFVGSSTTINDMAYNGTAVGVGENLDMEKVIKLGSWDIYSSRYYHQIKKFNIFPQDRLMVALATSESAVYVVQKENTEEIQLIKRYIEEHTNKEILVKHKDSLKKAGIEMYQFEVKQ